MPAKPPYLDTAELLVKIRREFCQCLGREVPAGKNTSFIEHLRNNIRPIWGDQDQAIKLQVAATQLGPINADVPWVRELVVDLLETWRADDVRAAGIHDADCRSKQGDKCTCPRLPERLFKPELKWIFSAISTQVVVTAGDHLLERDPIDGWRPLGAESIWELSLKSWNPTAESWGAYRKSVEGIVGDALSKHKDARLLKASASGRVSARKKGAANLGILEAARKPDINRDIAIFVSYQVARLSESDVASRFKLGSGAPAVSPILHQISRLLGINLRSY